MTVGSHLLVNGVPLRKTEAAKDPKCPIHTTDVLALFRKQSKYRAEAIHLDTIHDGVEALERSILTYKHQGARILVMDSVTTEDMEIIA